MTIDLMGYVEIAGLIFAAGVFYAGVKRLRRDATGVRQIVDRNEKRRHKQTNKLLGILRKALPEEHREAIIQLLEEDDE